MKKTYIAPSAEVMVLLPQEEIASNWTWSWKWGAFDGAASRSTTNALWDNIYNGDDSSYKYNP